MIIHKKVIAAFQALHESDASAFEAAFTGCLNRVLVVFKKEASVVAACDLVIALGASSALPLCAFLLQHLLSRTPSRDKAVRYRACFLISGIMGNLGDDVDLPDALYDDLTDVLLERTWDKSPAVRGAALKALARLQDPSDAASDPVLLRFLSALVGDPSRDVRKLSLQHAAITRETLPWLLTRLQDSREDVRMATLKVVQAKVGIRSLRVGFRRRVLRRGLSDRAPHVREAAQQVLINWLQQVGGATEALLAKLHLEVGNVDGEDEDVVELLSGGGGGGQMGGNRGKVGGGEDAWQRGLVLAGDGAEARGDTAERLGFQVCDVLFQRVLRPLMASKVEELQAQFDFAEALAARQGDNDDDNNDENENDEKTSLLLTAERAFLWRALLRYCAAQPSPQRERFLEAYAPNLTVLTALLAHVARADPAEAESAPFILHQLLHVASYADFGDEAGRERLFAQLSYMLSVQQCDALYAHALFHLLRTTHFSSSSSSSSSSSESEFVRFLWEKMSEWRDPLEDLQTPEALALRAEAADDYERCVADLERAVKKKRALVKQEEYTAADALKQDIEALRQQALQYEEQEMEIQRMEDGVMAQSLLVTRYILQTTTLPVTEPGNGVHELLERVIAPSFDHPMPEIRLVGVQCLGLYCLLDKDVAESQMLFFENLIQQYDPEAARAEQEKGNNAAATDDDDDDDDDDSIGEAQIHLWALRVYTDLVCAFGLPVSETLERVLMRTQRVYKRVDGVRTLVEVRAWRGLTTEADWSPMEVLAVQALCKALLAERLEPWDRRERALGFLTHLAWHSSSSSSLSSSSSTSSDAPRASSKAAASGRQDPSLCELRRRACEQHGSGAVPPLVSQSLSVFFQLYALLSPAHLGELIRAAAPVAQRALERGERQGVQETLQGVGMLLRLRADRHRLHAQRQDANVEANEDVFFDELFVLILREMENDPKGEAVKALPRALMEMPLGAVEIMEKCVFKIERLVKRCGGGKAVKDSLLALRKQVLRWMGATDAEVRDDEDTNDEEEKEEAAAAEDEDEPVKKKKSRKILKVAEPDELEELEDELKEEELIEEKKVMKKKKQPLQAKPKVVKKAVAKKKKEEAKKEETAIPKLKTENRKMKQVVLQHDDEEDVEEVEAEADVVVEDEEESSASNPALLSLDEDLEDDDLDDLIPDKENNAGKSNKTEKKKITKKASSSARTSKKKLKA